MNVCKKLIASLLLATVATSAFAITDAEVFTYAEANYASYFAGTPISDQITYLGNQYDYRYYSATRNYLAVDTSGVVWVLGPVSGGKIQSVGPVSGFANAITAWETGGVTVALVTANDTTSVTVAWLDYQDAATPPSQMKYNIYISTDPKFTPSAATLNQSVTGQKQAVVTGLSAATTYYIQIVAIDQQGLSSANASVPASVTTLTTPVVLSKTTPLAKAEALNLSSPTVSGTTYSFSSTGGATLPAVGSVLVGADAGGKGYLAKVTGASITGGNVVVQTTQGVLSDAVTQGEISNTSTLFDNPATPNTNSSIASLKSLLTPANVPTRLEWSNKLLTFEENPAANLPPGISVKRNPANGRYTIAASQASDGTLSNIRQQILALTGSSSEAFSYDIGVTFKPKLTTDAKWSTGITGITLQKGVLMASGTLSLDAKAMYNFKASGSYAKDIPLDVFTRTYTSGYCIGLGVFPLCDGLPVYQQITFTLGAKLKANATAAVNATAVANLSETVNFGVQYNPATGAWDPVATTSHADKLTATLKANGGVTSQITLIPRVEVKFYSAVAGDFSVQPVLASNIQASSITNANFLTGSFPPGITQLTTFDASLNASCFVGANFQFLSKTIPLLSQTQVCTIPTYTIFSLPTLALSSNSQTNGANSLTATVTDGANDLFDDTSIQWTVYPTNAGVITPVVGQPRQASFSFNNGVASATIFFSGYGSLGELGRQFAQTVVKLKGEKLAIAPIAPSVASGATIQFTATATDLQDNPITVPSNLRWVSSDSSIATVDSNGLVTGVTGGATYITVTDPATSVSIFTTITVSAAPVVTLTATPSSIAYGAQSTLNWTSTNSTSCTSTGGGGTGTTGAFTTPSLTSSTTYTVSCTGTGGTSSKSATVTVAATAPAATSAPVVTLTATPSSIASGATSTLNWTSTNSTSCTSTGGGGTGTTGAFATPSLTSSTTYKVTCTGSGGTSSQSATVTVGAAALPAGYVSQGGLTWMPASATPYNYAQASALCAGTINGQTGWRLPTTAELSALSASGVANGWGWTGGGTWSSTGNHDTVVLSDGRIGWNDGTGLNSATCVR